MAIMLVRSCLFAPGHLEAYVQKALLADPDVAIIDLEDSVPNEDARALGRTVLSGLAPRTRGSIYVRTTHSSAQSFLLDAHASVGSAGVNGLVLPKVESEADVRRAVDELVRLEGLLHRTDALKLIPLVESCLGLENIRSILRASPRICAVAFGSEDYLADLCGGLSSGLSGASDTRAARAVVANAAGAAGVSPIDTVSLDVSDLNRRQADLVEGRALGFSGALLLHPREVALANSVFSPTESQLMDAQEVLNSWEEAKAAGRAVAIVRGRFVGPPMVRAAKATLLLGAAIEGR